MDGDTGKPVAEIDYGPISRTVTAKPWSDTTAKPLDDLKAAQRLVSGACGFTANLIVLGKDAGDAFESNPSVMDSYNKLAIQSGTLAPEYEQFGIVLLGTWRGIPLYVSEEQYEDSTGTIKYYVPPKEVLVAATGIEGIMAYAGIAQVSEKAEEWKSTLVAVSLWSIGISREKIIEGYDFPAVRYQFQGIRILGRSYKYSLRKEIIMANQMYDLPLNFGGLNGCL